VVSCDVTLGVESMCPAHCQMS